MCGPKRGQGEQQGLLDEHKAGSLVDASNIMRRDIALASLEKDEKVELKPYPSEYDAWHAAIRRVHQIPEPAQANREAREFALEAGGVNGISQVQCVRFTGLNGRTLEGSEFQVGGKRIFRSGQDSYSVEKTESGTYALKSHGNPLSEPFFAKKVEQLTPLNSAITRPSDSTGISHVKTEPLVKGQFADTEIKPVGVLRETSVPFQSNTRGTRETEIKEQVFLNQTIDASKGNKQLDETASVKLRHLIAGKEQETERGTTSGAVDRNVQKCTLERVIEFLRSNRELLVNGIAQSKESKPILAEILRIVGDFNRQVPSEGAKSNVLFNDIFRRTFDKSYRDGEKGINGGTETVLSSVPIPYRSPWDKADPVNFVSRLTPLQEQQLKAWLDKPEHRSDAAQGRSATVHGDILSIDGTRNAAPKSLQPEDLVNSRSDLGVKQELTLVLRTDISESLEAVKGESLASRLEPIIAEASFIGRIDQHPLDTKFDTINPKDPLTGKVTQPELLGTDDSLSPDLVEQVDQTIDVHPDGKEVEGEIADNDWLEKHTKESETDKESKTDDGSERDEEQHLANLVLLAQMRVRKEKDDKVRKDKGLRQEEDKKREASRRRRYKVKEHDTLESIATKELNDVKLAALIYQLNKNIIPKKVEDDKEIIELPPGLIIWLPSALDVQEFRRSIHSSGATSPQTALRKQYESVEEELAACLGTNWNGDIASKSALSVDPEAGQIAVSQAEVLSETLSERAVDPLTAAIETAKTRRSNIEKLLGPIGANIADDGRLRYVVRLGDTLKAISMKHPALQDASLWKLLAQVNDLPVPIEGKAVASPHLPRGTTLIIPSPEEIDKFRAKTSSRPFIPVTTGSVTNPNTAETVAKPCKQCGRLTVLSATICPACMHPFGLADVADVRSGKTSIASDRANASNKSNTADVPQIPRKSNQRHNNESVAMGMLGAVGSVSRGDKQNVPGDLALQEVETSSEVREQRGEFIKLLSDSCRLVKSGAELEQDFCLNSRIEVKRDNDWKPVISYEIYPDVSLRHEYSADGHRKTVRIDLPPTAASELASNDLTSNWQEYSRKYLD